MAVYDFEFTNGSGFYGEAGHMVTVRFDMTTASWNGCRDVLSEEMGSVGFGKNSIKLLSPGGSRTLAEIKLREPGHMFDTIALVDYISGVELFSPRPGVSAAGWRWRMNSRTV